MKQMLDILHEWVSIDNVVTIAAIPRFGRPGLQQC